MKSINLFDLLRRKNPRQQFVDRFGKLEHAGGVSIPSKTVEPSGGFDAQFDIVITRNTANITQDLDVAILGFTEILSGYRGFINPVTGGTVAVTGGIYNTLPDRYRFTHTLGLNTDTIDVTSPTHPYPSLIQSSGFDVYRINNIRYSVSDNAIADAQFNNQFLFRKRSIFGLEKSNPVSPVSFRDPMNNLNNIIDIPVNVTLDKETCIVLSMTQNSEVATAYETTLSFFVTFFNKYDSSKLMK